MNALAVLNRLEVMLSDEKRWSRKGYWAERKDGTTCEFNDPGAVKHCVIGALRVICDYGVNCDEGYYGARQLLHEQLFAASTPLAGSILNFNDHATHDELMKLIRGAIEAAKQQTAKEQT